MRLEHIAQNDSDKRIAQALQQLSAFRPTLPAAYTKVPVMYFPGQSFLYRLVSNTTSTMSEPSVGTSHLRDTFLEDTCQQNLERARTNKDHEDRNRRSQY
jgi:hypothetical protein